MTESASAAATPRVDGAAATSDGRRVPLAARHRLDSPAARYVHARGDERGVRRGDPPDGAADPKGIIGEYRQRVPLSARDGRDVGVLLKPVDTLR